MKKNEEKISFGRAIGVALLSTTLALSHASTFAENKPVRFTEEKIVCGMQDCIETHKRVSPLLYKEVALSDGWIPIHDALNEGIATITKKGSDKPLTEKEVWIAFYNNEKLVVNYDHDKWNWESAVIFGDRFTIGWTAYPNIFVKVKDKKKAARTAAEIGLDLNIEAGIETGILTVTAEGSNIPLSYNALLNYCNNNKKYNCDEAAAHLSFHWDHEKYPDWKGVSLGYIDINRKDAYVIIEMDPEVRKEKISKFFEEIKNQEPKKDNSSNVRELRKQLNYYNNRLNVKLKNHLK